MNRTRSNLDAMRPPPRINKDICGSSDNCFDLQGDSDLSP